MAITVNVNGVPIQYPQTGDPNWGENATNFAIQTSAALGKIGLSSGTSVDITQTLDVTGNTTLDSNLSVGGDASVTGNTTLDANLSVGGNASVTGTTNLTGNATIAGTLGISNGTASTPSIAPSGDTNTGLYSIGADKFGFAANGSRVGEFGVGYGGFTGNIIQVTSGQLTARATTTSTSFVATGLSATITPKYANSRILILVNLYIGPGINSVMLWSLVRNTTIYLAQSTGATNNSTGGIYITTNNTGNESLTGTTASFIDSPSTTSPITYSINFRSTTGAAVAISGRALANDFGGYSSITLLEVQS